MSSQVTASDAESVQKRKRAYEVVIEAVTQKKQKLQVTQTSKKTPPPGYAFVPAGLAQLTIRCKDVCRLRGLPIQIVSINRGTGAKKIHNHVQRLGYHFPASVLEVACLREGYILQNGKLEEAPVLLPGKQASRPHQPLDIHSTDVCPDQIIKGIRDLFPCIPDRDASAIARHAFRVGSGRVGDTTTLPFARRIQLAVLAYIRHNHTPYDKLLRTMAKPLARAAVEKNCLRILLKWRGEENSKRDETEEIFTEVIVLNDSDSECDQEVLEIEDEEEESEIYKINKEEEGGDDSLIEIFEQPAAQAFVPTHLETSPFGRRSRPIWKTPTSASDRRAKQPIVASFGSDTDDKVFDDDETDMAADNSARNDSKTEVPDSVDECWSGHDHAGNEDEYNLDEDHGREEDDDEDNLYDDHKSDESFDEVLGYSTNYPILLNSPTNCLESTEEEMENYRKKRRKRGL